MRTVRRAAAWVAWAEWICNSAAAQAVDDRGLADSNGRRGLFYALSARSVAPMAFGIPPHLMLPCKRVRAKVAR
jgi:hypothetical protein